MPSGDNPNSWKNLKLGSGWNKGMSKKNGDKLSYGKPRSEETKKRISDKLKIVLKKKGVYKKCLVCSKERYIYPSDLKRGNGLFCSKRCITLHHNLIRRTIDTDIELIIEKWLIENNIKHEKQKSLHGVTICDFWIEPNIVLYCDGDYWHTIPKVKKRDEWIDRQLIQKYNYKVIRLLGSQIKKGARPIELLLSQ